jgi:hypothetical protein
MVVARTMVDGALADELRASCMALALDLGGWDKPAKRIKRKPRLSRHGRLAVS